MNTQQVESKSKIHLPGFGVFMPELGGYFVDIIIVNGVRFGLASAPKALGERTGIWGSPGALIEGASHFSDGLANTQAMAAAGSELAKWALDLNINGQNDWYLASRDETERLYRHFKPSTQKNYCSYRDGENPNATPMGLLYTQDDPAQTSAVEFQKGRVEAMEEAWYLTSTQYSSNYAFCQDFYDGHQYCSYKLSEGRVRAVRRFIID